MKRRTLQRLAMLATTGLALALLAPADATAQRKDAVVIGMTLEPPGLDPTAGAAAAIGEIVHYNVFEGLTRVNEDGGVGPLLAESWTVSPDLKTYTFRLRRGVRFHNDEPFGSATVRYAFERAAAEGSTNKDRQVYTNIARIDTPDAHTVTLTLKQGNPDFLFLIGQPTGAIVEPKSASSNATRPIGTGPFRVENWVKGSSVTLSKWDGFRNAASIRLRRVTFRFIGDPAAQIAALLSGDVDAFPRVQSSQNAEQMKTDPRFTVWSSGTKGKTIIAMNNRRKPLDDLRVRRAISMAIDRKALIDGAMNGNGIPIGSHMVPGDYGYVDLSQVNGYDLPRAQALIKESGVALPLELSLKLPPPAYARQGGEVVAAQLAKIGVIAKIENVEWAQWLSGVYRNKNYDLTIISHVEPLDLMRYTEPGYYFQYDSPAFREIMGRVNSLPNGPDRLKALGDAQRQLANDAVNVWLFQLRPVSVASSRLKGLWKDTPVFVNDMSAVHWN